MPVLKCHKEYCDLVKHYLGKRQKEMLYIMRRKKRSSMGGWWCEPPRHVRLTPDGVIKAMQGYCSKGHVQVFEVNLKTLKVRKIFDGDNK